MTALNYHLQQWTRLFQKETPDANTKFLCWHYFQFLFHSSPIWTHENKSSSHFFCRESSFVYSALSSRTTVPHTSFFLMHCRPFIYLFSVKLIQFPLKYTCYETWHCWDVIMMTLLLKPLWSEEESYEPVFTSYLQADLAVQV